MVDSTTTSTQQSGTDQILTIIEHWADYGDIAGRYTSEDTVTLHPDKTGTFSGRDTCTCVVVGKSGTLIWSFSGTFTADGKYQGKFFDLEGTGELAKLHGQGTFQGQGNHSSYTSYLSFNF